MYVSQTLYSQSAYKSKVKGGKNIEENIKGGYDGSENTRTIRHNLSVRKKKM